MLLKDQRNKDIIIQLIQSANIFIHNLTTPEHKSKKHVGFLLSSDYFNTLVSTEFDFSDDDILENFISFFKGIAANLPSDLLLSYVLHTKFQVFIQSFRFFFHQDTMIRNASRTTILTIIKRNPYSVSNPSIFSFLYEFKFTSKILKKLIDSWEKLYIDLPADDNLLVENELSGISDDLLYINDLIEHVEELNSDICSKFLNTCIPWVIRKVSDVLNIGENFAPVGWVISSILDNIKACSIIDVLVAGLLSSKISEKIVAYMQEDTVQNNQFDYFDEGREVDNTVKHQMISLLNDPYCATTVLLIINNVVSNLAVSKRILYECCFLPKDELKTQILLHKVLQDKIEYTSDALVAEFLMQILLGEQSTFNVLLSGRIIALCRLHPEEKYLSPLKSEINSQVLQILRNTLDRIETEKFKEYVLEAFEDESEYVNSIKLDNKIEFPIEFLINKENLMPILYRMPISKKEFYQWNFGRLFLLRLIESEIYGTEKMKGIDEIIELEIMKSGCLEIGCEEGNWLKLDDFYLRIGKETGGEKVIRLRNVEIMMDHRAPTELNFICGGGKVMFSSVIKFVDPETCKGCKDVVEKRRKASKDKEMELIKRFLLEEREKRVGENQGL